MPKDKITLTESRAAFSLAGIFGVRMLGLFMIYPVFSLYARHLPDATPATIGIALGIYGLAQALLQIQFGMLSDRLGRKPLIMLGLLIFAAGSALAAVSQTIDGIIIGRALQGAGAVGSVILALVADLTREEHRTKAMAVVGMTIGLSFGIAVVLGPVFNAWIGVPGIFWLTAVLALCGVLILQFAVPRPAAVARHRDAEPVPALFKRVLGDGQLLRLDFGIFAQHAILTATFLALPLVLKNGAGLATQQQWYIYLPILVVSVFAMVPLVIVAEKYGRMKPIFLSAIVGLGVGQLILLYVHASLYGIVPALLVFFTAFNLLESTLPSLISKVAPPDSKGTAMGVYSSSQFFGIFVGGSLGGWLQGHFGFAAAFGFSAVMAALWLIAALSMKSPGYLSSRLLKVGRMGAAEAERLAARLKQVAGVIEVVIVGDEGVAYIKVDRRALDEGALESFAL
jgi:MFS family permease